MSKRIEEEHHTVEIMIRLYCKHKHYEHTLSEQEHSTKHGTRTTGSDALCTECSDTLAYAEKRLRACPFQDRKPTCRRCTVHCYKPEMRQRIREIMRWAGPRMMLHHPVETMRHLLREWKLI